ncbi:uncharacterized protein MYCFIDRAFT_207690 [Pseudocercospora fijiensis CIRAD86]|uniref:Alkaline phosphatase n=1 Tax=Pseudocercospora fijiensis (strain CIRAD86) TaxID=383855 RepID=M2YZN8_PSEFD|nr:uncharacterized protein MYCFIDRAFT_207690 [Pseudocercospora fijiensis CIRAD86]EME83095.1 hypothetical protein MYCFIDRAFT_207690 [Pseudocercospora fijiensis CIRAD86]
MLFENQEVDAGDFGTCARRSPCWDCQCREQVLWHNPRGTTKALSSNFTIGLSTLGLTLRAAIPTHTQTAGGAVLGLEGHRHPACAIQARSSEGCRAQSGDSRCVIASLPPTDTSQLEPTRQAGVATENICAAELIKLITTRQRRVFLQHRGGMRNLHNSRILPVDDSAARVVVRRDQLAGHSLIIQPASNPRFNFRQIHLFPLIIFISAKRRLKQKADNISLATTQAQALPSPASVIPADSASQNPPPGGYLLGNYLTDRYWEKGWDTYQKYVNGKKVESVYTPYEKRKHGGTAGHPRSASSSSSSSSSNSRVGRRSAPEPPPPQTQGHSLTVKSPDSGGGVAQRIARPELTGLPGAVALAQLPTDVRPSTYHSREEGSRRLQAEYLPISERDVGKEHTRGASTLLQQEEEYSKEIRRQYRAETDDPRRPAAEVLPKKDLWTLDELDPPNNRQLSITGPSSKRESILKDSAASRRDSAVMASGYNDNYNGNTQYQGEGRARSAQPPKSRYYDDDDSDYDERSGKRTSGRGRGWDDRYDDRDYDRVEEVTERYRGPVSAGPLVVRPSTPVDRPYATQRGDSYRSGYDAPYGAGAVTQYGRRSDGALDRSGDRESYVSRRSKSRGRSDRDRSYSRSRSRSRSNERERGEGIRGKIEDAFDTSGRGLATGLAGAVIGGLAGRQFGQRHQQRDILIGAVVGGLGANLAENKYREWKDEKRDREERWEQRYDGRSRSNKLHRKAMTRERERRDGVSWTKLDVLKHRRSLTAFGLPGRGQFAANPPGSITTVCNRSSIVHRGSPNASCRSCETRTLDLLVNVPMITFPCIPFHCFPRLRYSPSAASLGMAAGDAPVIQRPPSQSSGEGGIEEEDALLTGQRTGKTPATTSTSRNADRYQRWREIGLFVWAVIATAVVIVLAVVWQHNSQTSGKHGGSAGKGGKRNLIFMVSDGMGPTSLTLTRSWRQYTEQLPWDETLILDEHLIGQSRTRSSSSLVTDSAAGATAFSCGKKSYNGAISVLPNFDPCGSVMEAAKKMGYTTGLVVYNSDTDATPCRIRQPCEEKRDGGRYCTADDWRDASFGKNGGSYDWRWEGGCRADDIDVIDVAGKKHDWNYIGKRDDFDNLGTDAKLPLLALFAPTDIPYEIDRRHQEDVYPSLAETAKKALDILSAATQDKNQGFFIMIEGSRIDHAGHANDPAAQVHEVLAYDRAMSAVLDFIEHSGVPTLMVSTSDHETGGLATARQLHEEYPDYLWYPSVLANASHSASYAAQEYYLHQQKRATTAIIETESKDEETYLKSLIKSALGIHDPTSAELSSLINHESPASYIFADMISRRAQTGWSTHGHSGADVNIYASDPVAAEALKGNHENIEVGQFLRDYLGVNAEVEKVTEKLKKHMHSVGAEAFLGSVPEEQERLDGQDHLDEYHGDHKTRHKRRTWFTHRRLRLCGDLESLA